MSNHFIKNIEIKNFKCFDNFKAEGFGRVNLIGGKNNVGKTAFMEACLINIYSTNLQTLVRGMLAVSFYRNVLEFSNTQVTEDELKNNLEGFNLFYTKSNINEINYQIFSEEGKKEYLFQINNIKTLINIKEFSYEQQRNIRVKYIDTHGYDNQVLKEVYESVQLNDAEPILFKFINDFDKNIINFKIIGGDKPQCKMNDGSYRDLKQFGDGVKHYISIIASLYATKNSYLFIDEIENGIHYTNLDKLWEIILTISKQQNVQVFATTHSKECIESYARVAKKLEDEEITMTVLARNPKNEIKALVYDDKMFYSELEQNHEVRGW